MEEGKVHSKNPILVWEFSSVHYIHDLMEVAVPPILPLLIREFTLSHLMAGLVTMCINLPGSLLQPIIGFAFDRKGKHKVPIVLGILWLAAGLLLLSTAPTFDALLVFAVLASFGRATYHAQATVYLSQYFPEARGKAMGIHGVGGGWGHFSSPIIIGMLASSFGWRHSLRIIIIPGLICVLVLWLKLKKVDVKKEVHINIRAVITKPIILLTLIMSLRMLGFIGMSTFLTTFFVEEKGLSIAVAGVLSSISLVSVFFAMPLWGWISDRVGRRRIYNFTLFSQVASILFFLFGPYPFSLAGLFFQGFFSSAVVPVSLAFASELVPPHILVTGVSILFGLSVGMSQAGILITGCLIDLYGFYVAFSLPLFLIFAAGFLSFALPRNTTRAL